MKQKKVLAIGRWMPIHLGHKSFLVNLAKQYDKLIIGIGSCYENGTARNCIPAVEREKLLRKILKIEGISEEKIKIIPIEDRETFEEWIDDVSKICKDNQVTHFCTGNKEDILNVLAEKGIDLNLEMINPEDNSNFPYHATDVRNAILNKDIQFLNETLPKEIIGDVIKNVSKEIIAANKGEGKKFMPGRQTVDIVFSVKNQKDGKIYTLIGRRDKDKIDFPGYNAIPGGGINEFESPVDAISRVFLEETGLNIEIIDNTEEPAKVRIKNISDKEQNMYFTGIYASPDEKINGSRGGGSQCFSVLIDGDIDKIKEELFSRHDLEDLGFVDIEQLSKMRLAFEQKEMVFDSFKKLEIDYEKEEELEVLDENGNSTGKTVSRKVAHEKGILHGASHTYIYRENDGRIEILLQRRSHNKDSFPDCLDISSAGHMEEGLSFEETAIKELEEELGLQVKKGELTNAFKQRFSNITEYNGKQFNNQEINEIYLLKKEDLDLTKLKLQEEEVSEVVWMDVDEITKRLEQNDQELCLDKEEFLKVLEKIRKREKKMEDSKLELKDIYDDAILEGTIRGAELTKRFQGRRRVDNTSGNLMELMSGKISARLAKEKQGDGIVANGISTALQSSMIIYGKIGEEFLKAKLSKKGIEFSQREYSKRCAEAIVRGYKGKRGAKIVEGVLLAIDNNPNNIEANAAKAGIMINEYTNELDTKNKEKVKEDYSSGKVIESSIIFERLDEMNYKQISNNEKISRLEILYNFINANKEKVNFERLKKNFPDASEDELIGFYIANLDEAELERGLLLADRTNEEHTID